MGQKINPISNRLGYIRGWDSNWYGGNKYGDKLLEDSRLRRYLSVRLAKASVSRIVIERALKHVTITICTARPGIVIGKGGQDVDTLKESLKFVVQISMLRLSLTTSLVSSKGRSLTVAQSRVPLALLCVVGQKGSRYRSLVV